MILIQSYDNSSVEGPITLGLMAGVLGCASPESQAVSTNGYKPYPCFSTVVIYIYMYIYMIYIYIFMIIPSIYIYIYIYM